MAQGQVADDRGAAPQAKKTNKLYSVCMYILVVEMCERLCYYTIFQTMVNYLEDAGGEGHKKGASAAFALRSSFRMLAYVMPVMGGYVADNCFGRYKTILWFTIAYVIGVAMMAVGAIPGLIETSAGPMIYIVGAFAFTALGTGAIKPNVVNFGADQYDTADPVEAQQQKSYFSYFYMVINIGSIFSAIWTASLATSDVTKDGPGSGFVKSFTIAAVAMALALLAFLAGTPKYSSYSRRAVTRSPMVSIIRRHLTQAAGEGMQGKLSLLGFILIPIYLIVTLVGSLLSSQPAFLVIGTAEGITLCSAIAAVLCTVSCACLIMVHKNNDWVKPLMGEQVAGSITTDEVKTALRVIPTLMCINVGFNVGYNGMDIYGAAACQMDVRVPNISWLRQALLVPKGQFNGNFYSLGNNFSIITAIPLLEGVLLPALERARGGPIPRKFKYAAGFILIILANCIGIVIELVRRQQPFIPCPLSQPDAPCGNYTGASDPSELFLLSQCSPKGVLPMSAMSGWWTFIPFFVTGCGEVLVNPILQEFAFDEVAPRLRSLMMGFTLVSMGCTPSVITAIFSGFVPSDMNSGPVIWCYVANNVVSVVLLVAFFFIALPDRDPNTPLLPRGEEDQEGSIIDRRA